MEKFEQVQRNQQQQQINESINEKDQNNKLRKCERMMLF